MVVSIKYTDGDARSYKAVELHTRTDHHTFDSGDFPTDWFGNSHSETMSKDEWYKFVWETIQSVDDDTMLTVVDCHI